MILQESYNIATAQVSVGATATQIVGARARRESVTIVNHGTTDVYIGGPAVTTSTGLLLLGTKGASVVLDGSIAIYGIVATGSQTVSCLESY